MLRDPDLPHSLAQNIFNGKLPISEAKSIIPNYSVFYLIFFFKKNVLILCIHCSDVGGPDDEEDAVMQ